MTFVPRLLGLVVLMGTMTAAFVSAAEPLHVQIDRLVAQKFADQKPAPRCDDAAFLRRVMLDLAGKIPSAEETRKFVDSPASDKRAQLIDQLLVADSYADRMQDLFHVVLMERRGENPEWAKFLHYSFEQNKPWDQIAQAMLAPKPQEEQLRGGAFFMTKRLEKYGENPTDYSGLTRDVGRLFLGVDLQCAECHDHLFIEDYKQVDFQGLMFVYKNLGIQKEKFPAIKQTAMTEKLEFISVFDPTQKKTGPRVPFGKELSIPDLPKPPPDKKPAKKNVKPVIPGFDPLSLLAEEVTAKSNAQFNKNIVNRLWFAMMGRGLVMPLDLFHADNPPSHPELLNLLSREFVAQNYDIKWFLRELALTETYQRSSLWPEGATETPPADRYLVALEKRLSSEQLLASLLKASGNEKRIPKINSDGKPHEDFAKLEKSFLAAFANEAREPELDINPTVKAALFLLNDETVLDLLNPHAGNLMDRLSKLNDPTQIADTLYLSIFSRSPSEEEREFVAAYLKKHATQRQAALKRIAWGMLSSMEFCVNH